MASWVNTSVNTQLFYIIVNGVRMSRTIDNTKISTNCYLYNYITQNNI